MGIPYLKWIPRWQKQLTPREKEERSVRMLPKWGKRSRVQWQRQLKHSSPIFWGVSGNSSLGQGSILLASKLPYYPPPPPALLILTHCQERRSRAERELRESRWTQGQDAGGLREDEEGRENGEVWVLGWEEFSKGEISVWASWLAGIYLEVNLPGGLHFLESSYYPNIRFGSGPPPS